MTTMRMFSALVLALLVATAPSAPPAPGRAVTGAPSEDAHLGPAEPGRTWVPSRPKPKSVLWAVGDGADGGAASRGVAEMLAARRMHRFLYLGDVYQTGTAAEYERNYRPVFGRFDAWAAPTIGNHEWPNRATGYAPYWTAARGAAPPDWYAFAVSGWQLISLNSIAPAASGSVQQQWLADKLSGSPRFGNCRIAFLHHPRYSASLHGDTPELEPLIGELRGRARLLLSGHDHNMQRFEPVGGLTQLVVGSGGRGLYPVADPAPGLVFFEDARYGALKLVLGPGRAVASFVAADGALLDRQSLRCGQKGVGEGHRGRRR